MKKAAKIRVVPSRRHMVPLFVLVGVVVVASFGIALATSTTTTFYLEGAGVPIAALAETAPSAGTLPNFDPGRDDAPGLLLHKGGEEHETDPTKHQMWLAAAGDLTMEGPVTFTFWAAMKDFDTDKKGQVKAFLVDCGPSGTDCVTISSAVRTATPWNSATGWIARTIDFGIISYTIGSDRSLAVELVVTEQSQDDMWFAYDTALYASALVAQVASPLPTTSTTSAPNPPPTTTTTTTRPPDVASTTTTTTIVPPATSTTITTLPPTTTTIAGAGADEAPPTTAAPEDVVPEEDFALLPLPNDDGDQRQGRLTSGLLDSLALAIPPSAASSLLSPLLLLESILGAFIATGRGLVVPGLLLVAGILATEGWRRRKGSRFLIDQVEAQP